MSERVPVLLRIRLYAFDDGWIQRHAGEVEDEPDCSYAKLVQNYLPDVSSVLALEGQILYHGGRPVPRLESCEIEKAVREEIRERSRQEARGN